MSVPAREPARRYFKTGRGVAPHWADQRARWIVIWWLALVLDFSMWRVGVAVGRGRVSINVGPVSIVLGRPVWRWRVQPATTSSLTGVSYQDYDFRFSFPASSDTSSGEA